jgi:hypothetical protein
LCDHVWFQLISMLKFILKKILCVFLYIGYIFFYKKIKNAPGKNIASFFGGITPGKFM